MGMKFGDVISLIEALSESSGVPFPARSERICKELGQLSSEDLFEHLEYAAVIPEKFDHDSTEEKLYAKYCDALLARALEFLGLSSSVIAERADAADVEAATATYRLVGDAKAFRLSRTAKNQKDFKVTALSHWRRGANYACLVAPLYQYPTKASQIYEQAIRENVTLLSYTHLKFLLSSNFRDAERLKPVWEVGTSLEVTKSASVYWTAVAETVCEAAGRTLSDWKVCEAESLRWLPKIALENILFWESEKERLGKLSHSEAISHLLEALKIESKIETIKSCYVDLLE